ncbi:hypothetical protein Ade02nite_70220 [Paractinoplanes deccanensis]|uniref:Uncharacterized protein n=1 Tax=Paractinoplanes deccanensis TaxID=113561 RepID=A0ABQ3YEE2_9ACTN|nr:hypothetical protein Ade02nite_70220 [Actinoplanes deccanensis]
MAFEAGDAVLDGVMWPVEVLIERGSGARPADPQACHADTAKHRDELRTVPTMPDGHHHRKHLLTLLAGQVCLRGQPATRTPEGVIGGFVVRPTPGSR